MSNNVFNAYHKPKTIANAKTQLFRQKKQHNNTIYHITPLRRDTKFNQISVSVRLYSFSV